MTRQQKIEALAEEYEINCPISVPLEDVFKAGILAGIALRDAELEETINFLPKVPMEPYEKEISRRLNRAEELLRKLFYEHLEELRHAAVDHKGEVGPDYLETTAVTMYGIVDEYFKAIKGDGDETK